MATVKGRVGLLGGTFDPVHNGHLAVARAALGAFALESVWFLPSALPPHKATPPLASAAERAEMVALALAGEPGLALCDLELRRGGVSYAVDTLRAFRREFPQVAPWFVIGMDSLLELHRWREVGTLLELCTFATLCRPGFARRPTAAQLGLPPPWPERLLANIAEGPMVPVASRQVRARLARGGTVDALVPATVARYIAAKGLYAPPAGCGADGGGGSSAPDA